MEGSFVRELLRRGSDLLYPPKCIFCGAPLTEEDADGACKGCWAELPHTSEAEACQRGLVFQQCASPFFMTGMVDQALIRYKYHQKESYGPSFGRWMGECARRRLTGPFDVITWVPVSRRRLWRRGFDQSRLLAEGVAKEYGMRPLPTLRRKHTPSLTRTKGGNAVRRKLVAGVFTLCPSCDLAGKRVLLVDDIITTGSTLDEAAGALFQAGASCVYCVTAARGRI